MMADAVTTPEVPATPAPVTHPAPTTTTVPGKQGDVHVHIPAGAITPPPTGPSPLSPTVVEQLQEFGQLKAKMAQMEFENRAREAASQAEQVRLLTEKGQTDAALALTRETAKRELDAERQAKADAENRAKSYALTGELSRALAGQPLVEGGAEVLTELWQKHFVVEPKGNTYEVRNPQTYQSPGEFIASQLALPKFSHFLRATTTGGVGAPGASATTPTPPATTPAPHQPATGGEALVLKAIAARKALGPHPHLTGGTSPEGQAMAAAGFGLYAPIQQTR